MREPIKFRWVTQPGEEFEKIPEEFMEGYGRFFEQQKTESAFGPPKDLREFEDRLLDLLEYYYKSYFGLAYYLDFDERKRLEKNTSFENLIDIALKCERKGPSVINIQLECYEFLKMALEKNFPFSERAQNLLGLHLDLSELTMPQKDIIAVQSVAQVLWYLEKSEIPSIEAMVEKRLKNRRHPFFELLEFEKDSKKRRPQNSRTLGNRVRAVYPVPQEQRKQHSKEVGAFDAIIPISDIFTEKGINFPRLRFALICVTRVMKALDYPLGEIIKSRPIELLVDSLLFYPQRYARDWVEEAYSSNGSIYSS